MHCSHQLSYTVCFNRIITCSCLQQYRAAHCTEEGTTRRQVLVACRPTQVIAACRRRHNMSTSAYTHKRPSATAATDAVEGGLAQSLGNFLFRSSHSEWLWNTSISAPYRVVRIAAMTLIAWILLARSWKLFLRCTLKSSTSLAKSLQGNKRLCNWCCRPSFEFGLVLLAMLAASWQFGLLRTLLITIAALSLTLAKQLASTPEVNAGHRAGGKGFTGI